MAEAQPPSDPVAASTSAENPGAGEAAPAAAAAASTATAPAEPPVTPTAEAVAPAAGAPADVVAPAPAAAVEPPATPAADPVAASPAAVDPAAPADPTSAASALDQFSIEELLSQASFEDPAKIEAAGGGAGGADPAAGAERFKLPSFQQVNSDAQVSSIDLLRDVELNV